MKITYDPKVDILNIELREGPVCESDELEEGFSADYDSKVILSDLRSWMLPSG